MFAAFSSSSLAFLSSPPPTASSEPNLPRFSPSFHRHIHRSFHACPVGRGVVALVRSRAPEGEELPSAEDEWLSRLPEKDKPLYSHSLPCIEAWLRSLGFHQSKDERALWLIQKLDWHAQLSLDITDLYIRYLKSGPGNIERDVERRFSYALSREDIENAIQGGP